MTTREVVLDGGSPWGFRMHGGADVTQPLRISRVNPGSKAALRGIREGDFITSINGQSTKDISNAEAHTLLKNAGDTLVLGLNEDCTGSPKRRQYKTVHQETHQESHSETVKKSTLTTYSVKTSKAVDSIESLQGKSNGLTSVQNYKIENQRTLSNNSLPSQQLNLNGTSSESSSTLTEKETIRNISSDNAIASQRSSYSNLTSSPSTATLTEDGTDPPSAINNNSQCDSDLHIAMADNGSSSRSRRRRARNNKKKNKKQCDTLIPDDVRDNLEVETHTSIEIAQSEESKIVYRVDSPETVADKTTTKSVSKQTTSMIKSRSLDNDEMLQIQELSDASENEKGDNQGIISEASESEVEWEEAEVLDLPEAESGTLSSMSLPLHDYCTEEINLISPEEELTLRNFLEGLNLVNSPEEAAKQTYEKSTADSIKIKKIKKREALEQYFLPMLNNPRFLDVINEEASDQSDKEIPNLKQHLKQGTPELEIPPADTRPPVPVRRNKRVVDRRNYQIDNNPTILVGAKIIDPPTVTDNVHSKIMPESTNVEVVYLSSHSNSPDGDSDYEDCKENSTSACSTESLPDSLEETIETRESVISVKKQILNNDDDSESILIKNTESITQLTPPPTPDNVSPKYETKQISNGLPVLTEINIPTTQVYNIEIQRNNLPDLLHTNKTQMDLLPTTNSSKEEVLNKEVASISETLQEAFKYSNVVSPPAPSRSPSPSSGSSSRATSLCTAKYNPMNSSVGDMSTFVKEDCILKEKMLFQPLALRELCLKYLISMPFGEEILQELADVSQSIEPLTNKLPSSLLPKIAPNLPAFVYNKSLSNNNGDSNFPVTPNNIQEMPAPSNDKWVGIPTEQDPNLLLYLSPMQKEQLEKTKKVSDEAGKLLDLHEKFVSRRTYNDTLQKFDEQVTITSINNSSNNVSIKPPVTSSHRLLAIIREEPSSDSNASSEIHESTANTTDHLHFKEVNPKSFPTRNCATLPRNKFHGDTLDSARLKAKDLSEWLQLARHKSMSESNLATAELKRESPHVSTNNRMQSENTFDSMRRRTSLPQELYERQLQYLIEKEQNIQRELEHLEEAKRKLTSEMAPSKEFHASDYHISRKGDYAVHTEDKMKSRPTSMPAMPTEFFRQQMYEEYMNQIAAREERKQNKVIKVSSSKPNLHQDGETHGDSLGEVQHISAIEDEFMEKVKQKKGGDFDKEKSVEKQKSETPVDEGDPVLIIDGDLKSTKELPKHLREFISITKQSLENSSITTDGIWAPGQKQEISKTEKQQKPTQDNESIPPVWTPKSANSSPIVERKEFKPVNFQSPVLSRKNKQNIDTVGTPDSAKSEPPWKIPETSGDIGVALSSLEKRLPTSHSASSVFSDFTTPRLPKAQNPTITLLQKSREGQLPRGAHYIEQEQQQYRRSQNERTLGVNPVYTIKNEYISESDSERPRKLATLGPRQFQGIGPTTKDGMPLILRSEVRDTDQSKWYKKMYDTIHKQKPHSGEYVTVRYKQKRAQYPYSSGYLSEPEPGAYDSDFADYKYATLDKRRTPYKEREYNYTTSTMPRTIPNKSSSSSDIIRNGHDLSKNQPGRIENYTPGHSSISEKEAKEWWDEVMDIFDGHLEQQKRVPIKPRSFLNPALKESGYESDSTLVFRRKEEQSQLSPKDQKEAYKVIQKGGDVPLHGLRKPAPERPKDPEPPIPPPKGQHFVRSQAQESPRKYVENDVTIHYRTPVRQEVKECLSEDELLHRQNETIRKIQQEERRRKYLQVSKSLQELQDMNSRRHTDNFIPSQKSPIALNRYDDFDDLTPTARPRPRSPEPRLVARALHNFVGQTARELTFRKGDLIFVRRQVDMNWYEGELNAMVGLFPVNHVEIVPYDNTKTTPRKSYEGQARAKYNFVAQTHLELSLAKGELVIITRRVDDNWFEGKIGGRKGIFPVSYVEILIDPHEPPPPSSKPVASPAAHSVLLNGSAGGKDSMGSHSYTPSVPNPQLTTTYQAKPIQITTAGTYGSLNRAMKNPVNQALHIDTQSEPVPYRALYKYNPQNDDELELLEGDTVFVLEKCDDGWYVGSSDRTGAFGTFPGNYVEKI